MVLRRLVTAAALSVVFAPRPPALVAQQASRATAASAAATASTPFAVARRPVATYSIVARDPRTGEMGVAVQSHWFSVGPIVAWAEAGVGAVATQSFVEPSYGPLGLELMRTGRTAEQALAGLLAADPFPGVRQVAMIDRDGNVAAHTGEDAIIAAGHAVGEDFSVQANLMEHATVWPAMAEAFRSAEGDLAARMLAALRAAQAAGGDIRGRQSAALLVVSGESTGQPWVDRVFDLRIEDHPEPLVELARLLHLARAYRAMNAGDAAVTEGDIAEAVELYDAASEMVPESAEMVYWAGVTLAAEGRIEDARARFERAFAADPRWAILTPRLLAAGILPDDPALLASILAFAGGAPGREEWERLAAEGLVRPPS